MSDFATCYINVLKAMIGTGLIYFPITFYTCGVIPTILGIIISICFSVGGFYIYVVSNSLQGPGTINSLCRKVNHYFYIFANLMLIVMMVLTAVAYINLIEESYFKIFEYFGKKLTQPKLLMTGHILLLVLPISCFKTMSHLRFTSFIGVVAVLYILFLSLTRFFKNIGKHAFVPNLFGSGNINAVLLRLPFYVFSFTAHQTILPLQNEFFTRPPNFFLKVVIAATVTAGFIYSLLGITMNFLYDFSKQTFSDSCLSILPNDVFGLFARVSYLLLLTFSIPLQLIPLKIILIEVFKKFIEKNILVEKVIGYVMPIILNILTFLIYFARIGQEMVQNLSGAVANTSACLVFPATIFLYGVPKFLYSKTQYTNKWYRILCFTLLLWSLIVFTAFIIDFINKIGQQSK